MIENNQKKELKSLYLLYGEERYLLENSVKKIKKDFGELVLGINYIQLNEISLANLIENIEMPAFGFDKKLIIIQDSGLFKKSKTGKKLNDYLTNNVASYIEENIKMIKQNCVIVFIEENIEKNKLVDIINKDGLVYEFKSLKLPDIIKKLKDICNSYEVKVDEQTLKYFVEICGTDMQVLINEIRKLIEYAGKNGTITKVAIDKLAIKQLEIVIFDLTDSLGNKKVDESIQILKQLIYQKEPIQKILITLYNHFKKLYIVKLSEKYNSNVAENLKLKPNQTFLISKYSKQAKYFKENELKKILEELIELDNKSKSGLLDINIGLEAILCVYCT